MVSETNIALKAKKVETVKERLSKCQMIFAARSDGLTVAQISKLRNQLPPTTTVATVKNTLMRRAIADSEWELAGEFISQPSMWFFVEDDFKGTVKAFESFTKELKREELKGGVFEGKACSTTEIQSIAALPSKIELITKVAVALKMVPTKLGKSINSVPTKVARSIKLAVADEKGGDAASE